MKQLDTTTARASYERHILTLDLPRAVHPMIWRQEIKNISNVAFWLNHQDNGEYALMLRLAGGAEQTIARFNQADAAEQSLAAIRTIFINGKPKHGNALISLIKYIVILILLWVSCTFVFQLAVALTMKNNPPDLIANPAATSTHVSPAPVASAPTPAPDAPLSPPPAPTEPPAEH